MGNQILKLLGDRKKIIATGPVWLLMLGLCLITMSAYAVDLMSPIKKFFGGGSDIIVWQDHGQFVKIVEQDWGRDHRRAPANDHPQKIDQTDLAAVFASLKSGEQDDATASGRSVPLFTAGEIEILIPKLVDALNRAGPQQDVVFAVAARREDFTGNQYRSSAGRMFLQQDRLNIIFGDVLSPVRDKDSDNISHFAKPHRAGKRMKWVDRDVRVADGSGITYWEGLNGSRPDWVLIDVAATVAAYKGPRIELTTVEGGQAPDNKTGDLQERRQMQEEIVRLRKELEESREADTAVSGNEAPVAEEPMKEEAVKEEEAGTTAPPAVDTKGQDMAANHELIKKRLNTLKSLYEEQLITDEEYTAKRREILEEF